MYNEKEETFPPELMSQLMTVMYCGILPVICVIGTLGNALTFYVFYHEKKKTSTTYLLLGLTLADELCMFGQWFYVFIQVRNFYFKEELPSLNVNGFFLTRLTFTLESVSKVLTVVIVTERCLAVYRPLKVHIVCSCRTSILLTASVYIFILTSCSVELFYIDIRADNSSVSTYQMALVAISDNGLLFGLYGSVLQILYGIVTVILITCGNIAIIIGIKRNPTNIMTITDMAVVRRLRKQRKMTRMLLAMSVVYVLCCLPKETSLVVMMSDQSGMIVYDGNYYFQAVILFGYCLAALNNAVNFIIYAMTTNSMRQKYINICCRRHGNGNRRHFSSGQSSQNNVIINTHM